MDDIAKTIAEILRDPKKVAVISKNLVDLGAFFERAAESIQALAREVEKMGEAASEVDCGDGVDRIRSMTDDEIVADLRAQGINPAEVDMMAERCRASIIGILEKRKAAAKTKPPTFKVGQRVRIARAMRGWKFWVDEMDDEVGRDGVIDSKPAKHGGIVVDIGDGKPGYWYPPEALDPIDG